MRRRSVVAKTVFPVTIILMLLFTGGTGGVMRGSASTGGQGPGLAEAAAQAVLGMRMFVRTMPHVPQFQSRVVPRLSDIPQARWRPWSNFSDGEGGD